MFVQELQRGDEKSLTVGLSWVMECWCDVGDEINIFKRRPFFYLHVHILSTLEFVFGSRDQLYCRVVFRETHFVSVKSLVTTCHSVPLSSSSIRLIYLMYHSAARNDLSSTVSFTSPSSEQWQWFQSILNHRAWSLMCKFEDAKNLWLKRSFVSTTDYAIFYGNFLADRLPNSNFAALN